MNINCDYTFIHTLRTGTGSQCRELKIDLDVGLNSLKEFQNDLRDCYTLKENAFIWLYSQESHDPLAKKVIQAFVEKIIGTEAYQHYTSARNVIEHPGKNPSLAAFCCIEFADAKKLETILKLHDIDPSRARNSEGKTLLGLAVFHGLIDCVKVLLKHPKTNPNLIDFEQTPLCIAVINHYLDIVKALLEDERTDPNLHSKCGLTPLGVASQNGSASMVKAILANERTDPNKKCMFELAPLSIAIDAAISFNNTDAALALLEDKRTDPNLSSTQEPTPLHKAVAWGLSDLVEVFLRHPKIDPNLSHPVFKSSNPLTIALRKGISGTPSVVEMLTESERVELFPRSVDKTDSPFVVAVTSESTEIRNVNQKNFPVTSKDLSISALWTRVSYLPVSCDSEHKPSENFLDNVEVINPYLFRNANEGELEISPLKRKKLIRVVYRTANFITVSVLHNNKPLGPTLYRPLVQLKIEPECQLKKLLKLSHHIWHIANSGISDNNQVVFKMIKDLADKHLMVFRALNQDHDVKLLVKGRPLKGRGYSKQIKIQVEGRSSTSLVSVSTEPMSKFLASKKKIRNGGFVGIMTASGSRLFLNFQDQYPAFIKHSEVLEEVSDDYGLTKRVIGAKEALFSSPIPQKIIVLLDGGYPSLYARKKNENKLNAPLPKNVQKLLNKSDLLFEALPKPIKAILLSNKSLNTKKKALEPFK